MTRYLRRRARRILLANMLAILSGSGWPGWGCERLWGQEAGETSTVQAKADLQSLGGFTYLVEGENYYLTREWNNGYGIPVRTDYMVVHIPAELKSKYVYRSGVGPNMVQVHGDFKYVGNVRGVNKFGGPVMLESYEAPAKPRPHNKRGIDIAEQPTSAEQPISSSFPKKLHYK
jgi:hypothetical protein